MLKLWGNDRFAALTSFGLCMQKFLNLMRRMSSKSLKKCLLRTEDGSKPQVFRSRYGRLIPNSHCRKGWISNFLQTGCTGSRGGRRGKADRWRREREEMTGARKNADNVGDDGEEENDLKHSSLLLQNHSAVLFMFFFLMFNIFPVYRGWFCTLSHKLSTLSFVWAMEIDIFKNTQTTFSKHDKLKKIGSKR